MDEGKKPYNFLAVSPQLWTSGQPTEAELAAIVGAGFADVVNLGLHGAPYALPDEAAAIAALGARYWYQPVAFGAPTLSDFNAFAATLDKLAERPVYIHCAANKRVSAFVALYGETRWRWSRARADAWIGRIWAPDPAWRTLIDELRSPPHVS